MQERNNSRFDCLQPTAQELYDLADQISHEHPDWSIPRCEQRALVEWYLRRPA